METGELLQNFGQIARFKMLRAPFPHTSDSFVSSGVSVGLSNSIR
jgi:hypothetical protein